MNDSEYEAFDLKIGKTIREVVLEILQHERKALARAFLEMENASLKSPKPRSSHKSSATASSKKVGKAAATHDARLTPQQKVDLITAPGTTQTPERRVKAVKDLGEGSKAAQQAMESLQKQGLVNHSKAKESLQKQSLVDRSRAKDIDSAKHDTKTSKHEDTETSESESQTSESESGSCESEPKAPKTRGIARTKSSKHEVTEASESDSETSESKPKAPKTRGIARRSTRLIDKPVKKSKVLLDIYDLGEPEDEAWDMPVYKNPPRYHRN